jgi:predicted aconitase with swiveling domain
VVAVTAVLAGIPLFGSNRSTLHEILAQVRAQEARRAQMIDGLGLQPV